MTTAAMTPRVQAARDAAIRAAIRIEAKGALGEKVCAGCAICSEPGIVAHYPPRRRIRGRVRLVYIDADRVIYDHYVQPTEIDDWNDWHTNAPGEWAQLPAPGPRTPGEMYWRAEVNEGK